jgi:uncharacterized membrane protein
MFPVILALTSAATFGAADFLGGVATRRGGTMAVVIISQAAGLALVTVCLPLLPAAAPGWRDVLWGVAAGLAGGVGVGLLYYGLATAPMTIVAPVTAVCAVLVPVIVGVAGGDSVSALTATGILLAVLAIVLVGQGAAPAGASSVEAGSIVRGLQIAIPSGLIIGLFLVALQRTPASAGLWPLVVARIISISLFGAGALATGQRVLLSRGPTATAIAGGTLDMLANILYLIAVRQGQLSVIATLASLYPASTVLLARLVLHERLTISQTIGVGGALAAIALIVSGSSG